MSQPPHDPDLLISVRNLGKTYRSGAFGSGFRALDGVSLEVGRGSVFGLLGPNGAGKTTLVKILMGLVPGWDGEVELFGHRPSVVEARRRVGFLPEAHRFPGYLTGRQALELFGMYSGRDRAWLRERIDPWLERLGMSASADRKLREYSKGMQQRIGLAQALIHEPELVFLDEPTDGVDPVGRAIVREIVSELQGQGITVFINSHLLMEVEKICDRVVIMRQGKLIREGTIEELTPRTGRVSFEIDPVPDDLEARLAGLGARFARTARGFEVDLSQDEQDAIVDRLRAAGVSLLGITAGKLTLEQAFIGLLKEVDA